MILYETPFVDAIDYATMIAEHEANDRRFAAGLHGIDLSDEGGVTVHGKSPLRRLHDSIAKKVKGGR